MKKNIIITMLFGTFSIYASENLPTPAHYLEFQAAHEMSNFLHTLVNETDITVKSGFDHPANPRLNLTTQGLMLYFENGHPTQLFTPFGSSMLFWNTRFDEKWEPVTTRFLGRCKLAPTDNLDRDMYIITHWNGRALPKPQRIIYNDDPEILESKRILFKACHEKYIHDGQATLKLDSYGKRKARWEKLNPPLRTIIWRIITCKARLNMLDLSN